MANFEQYRPTYEANWTALKIRAARQADADREARHLLAGKARYLEIERATGVPWWFVGLCHYRESHFNFDCYLGNGQSLSRVTTIVPAGRGPFPDFTAGAIDALELEGFDKIKAWSLARAAYCLEGFNGYGYHGKGVSSPYLYGGSTLYGEPEARAGKYVRDHDFDPNFNDTQLGTLVVLKALLALEPSIKFASPGSPPERQVETIERGILWVQRSLNELGADPRLAEDGVKGPRTMAMIARFQEESGLPATGIPDAATLDEIQKHLSTPAPAPAPKPKPKPPAPGPQPPATPTLFDVVRATLKSLFGQERVR